MSNRTFLAFLIFSLLVLFGCDGGSSPIDPGQDDPPDTDPNSETGTVTSDGGTVTLADGTAVVFPAGAVSSPLEVKLEKLSLSQWIDGTGEYEGTVISTTASVTQFSQPVVIRVPLPSEATPADSAAALVGLLDESTGALMVEHHSIEMIEGKPFLVLETDHFSKRLFQWLFGKTPPSSAGPLPVPYYNQGESNYCWAASLHMVTQAAAFQDSRSIADIIGKVGVDEGGITSGGFRFGSAISDLVNSRTGVRPLRQTWDYVNRRQMRDYLWREIGINGRPVALFVGQWNHAVVVVGYDGSDFTVHDPASVTTGSIGYTTRSWDDIEGGMGPTHNMVTLAVPRDLPGGDGPVRASFLPKAIRFIKPRLSQDDPGAIYQYEWDHTLQDGYSFHHVSHQDRVDPLPGPVTTVSVDGEIQLSNASRTQAREVSVWLDITGVDAPTGTAHYSTQKTVTVGPNSVANFKPDAIPVDTFRYNTATPSVYLFTVNALVDGSRVDRQSITLWIDSVTPEITAVVPASAGEGEVVRIRGKGFGSMAYNNAVTFNGTKVTEVVSWSDEEIQVKVPAGATTGPLEVKRGEVPSNTQEFTVAEYTTLTYPLNYVSSGDIMDDLDVTVSGSWSLRGEGAILDFSNDNYYSMETKMGVEATVSLSVSAQLSTGQITVVNPDNSTTVYDLKDPKLESSTNTSGSYPLSQSGDGGNASWAFTFSHPDQSLGINLTFGVSANVRRYNPDGTLDSETEDVYINGRTYLVLFIEPLFGE